MSAACASATAPALALPAAGGEALAAPEENTHCLDRPFQSESAAGSNPRCGSQTDNEATIRHQRPRRLSAQEVDDGFAQLLQNPKDFLPQSDAVETKTKRVPKDCQAHRTTSNNANMENKLCNFVSQVVLQQQTKEDLDRRFKESVKVDAPKQDALTEDIHRVRAKLDLLRNTREDFLEGNMERDEWLQRENSKGKGTRRADEAEN